MNILSLNDINRVLDASLEILLGEIGVIILNNRVERNCFAHQFENGLHGNARPRDARFPKMDFVADLNSIHGSNLHDSGHRSQGAAFPLTTQLPNNQPFSGARGRVQKTIQGLAASQCLSRRPANVTVYESVNLS